jgi:hypothetical protein
MTKCIERRKDVVVKEYENDDETKVSLHERNCLTSKADVDKEFFACCVCGEDFGLDDTHEFQVKGQTKQICKECVDTVHGLV